jgi:hexosaminidase
MSARELWSHPKLAIAIVGALLVLGCNPPAPAPPPGPQSGALPPRIIPLPASLSLAGGAPFKLTKETRVALVGANPEVAAIGETLAALLRRATDFPIPVSASSDGSSSGSVELRLVSDPA